MEELDHLNTYGIASTASEGPGGDAMQKQRRKSLRCQIVGCGCPLSDAGRYFQKKRVCKPCVQAEAVQRTGHGDTLWRFCQQCGKLETLDMFAGHKRSCKKALDRRRATGVQTNHTSPPQRRRKQHQHSDSDSPRSSSGDDDWGLSLAAAPAQAAAASPALLQDAATLLLQQRPLEAQLSCVAAAPPGSLQQLGPQSPAAGAVAVQAIPSPLFSSSGSPASSCTSASLTTAGGHAAAVAGGHASTDESLAAAAHLAQWFSGSDALLEPETDADAAMVDMWLADLQLPPIHEHARAPQPAATASDLDQLEQLIERAMLEAAAATSAATAAAGAATATSSGSTGGSSSLPTSLAATPGHAWPTVPAAAWAALPLEALLDSAVEASSAAAAAANQISHAARVVLLRQQYLQLQGAVEGVRRLMQQMALHAEAAAGLGPVGPGLSLAAHLSAQRIQPQPFPGGHAFSGAVGAFN